MFDDEDDVLEIIPASVFEPMPAESFVHKRILGALRGVATGGPIGGIAGFLGGGAPQVAAAPRTVQASPRCPPFTVPLGGQCVDPLAAGPGGRRFVTSQSPDTGLAVRPEVSAGMFGALSTLPEEVPSSRLRCPRGLVLGMDERCYAKGTIPPKLRKWRPATKPPVTAADSRAIRRAAATKTRVKKLAKDVGLHVHVHHRATAAKKGKK